MGGGEGARGEPFVRRSSDWRPQDARRISGRATAGSAPRRGDRALARESIPSSSYQHALEWPRKGLFLWVAEKEPGENPSFDPGPIDELRSNSDSGEGNLRVFGRAVNTVAKRQPIRRSDEAPQGGSRSEPSIPRSTTRLSV